MSLHDELLALETARKNVGGYRCRIGVILEQLPDKDATALRHLIDGTKVYGTQIAEALKKHGHNVSGSHIQFHRRRVKGGGCTCPLPDESA